MDYITTTLDNLLHQTAFFNLTWGNYVMIAVACFFLYLAIRHGFEPLLLLPIAVGMLQQYKKEKALHHRLKKLIGK